MGRSCVLIAVLIVSGCMTTVVAEPTNDVFEQFEVVLGTTNRQTVLTGFFLDGATSELVVVHADENDNRRAQMYGFDGVAWVPVLEATLRPDVLFVDVANISGRDRLITYGNGHMNWFDPDSATERALVAVDAPTSDPPRTREIPHVRRHP